MQIFCSKLDKKLFFANKDPKTNFDDWMILQKHVLSFKCNDFFKMANLKAISSSATLIIFIPVLLAIYNKHNIWLFGRVEFQRELLG